MGSWDHTNLDNSRNDVEVVWAANAQRAPTTARGFFVSEWWSALDTQDCWERTAIRSAILSFVVITSSFFVMTKFCLSSTLLGVATVFFSVGSSLGLRPLLINRAQIRMARRIAPEVSWEVDALSAMMVPLLICMSAEFVMYIICAYTDASVTHQGRMEKARVAFNHVGVTLTISSCNQLGVIFIMLFCDLELFRQAGLMLMLQAITIYVFSGTFLLAGLM